MQYLKELRLELSGCGCPRRIFAKQLDRGSRFLKIQLMKDGLPFPRCGTDQREEAGRQLCAQRLFRRRRVDLCGADGADAGGAGRGPGRDPAL